MVAALQILLRTTSPESRSRNPSIRQMAEPPEEVSLPMDCPHLVGELVA